MLAKSFFSFFLLFVLASSAHAQFGRNAEINEHTFFRGKVKTASESPVQHARVELRRLTGEMVGIVMTGDDGQFSFPMLATGSYVITVTRDGYETVREEVDMHIADTGNHTVYLRRPREPEGPGGITVSVRQLSLPDKAANAFRKGTDKLYRDHNAKDSIRQFHEAVSHYADYYEAYFQIGVAYTQMGKLDDAVTAFEKALQVSGHRYAPPLVGMAAIATGRGKFPEAAGLAQRAVDLESAMWQAHFELGRALLGMEKLAEAEKSLNKTRALKPDFPGLYLLFTHLHILKNDAYAVRANLQEYLRLDPDGHANARARAALQEVTARIAKAETSAAPPANKR